MPFPHGVKLTVAGMAGFVMFCSFCQPAFSVSLGERSAGSDQSFVAGSSLRGLTETIHGEGQLPASDEAEGSDWVLGKRLEILTAYEGNVFATRTDVKDDIITTYALPLSLSRRRTNDLTQLFYTVSAVRYVENSELNRVNHSMGSKISYKTDKFNFILDEKLTPSTAIAVGEKTELKTTGSSRVTTTINSLYSSMSYALSTKTLASFSYGNYVYYFPRAKNSASVANFSTQTHSFGPSLTYQWTPKTRISTTYRSQVIDYFVGTGAFDSVTGEWLVGLERKLTDKTRLTLELGLMDRNYRHIPTPKKLGYNAKGAVSSKLSSKLLLTLAAARNTLVENLNTETSPTLIQTTDDVGLKLTWMATKHLSADLGLSAGLISREGYITLADPDNPSLTFTREAKDDFYQLECAGYWTPKSFVTFALAYYYFNKNSSFKNSEYDNHRATISMEYQF